MDYSITELLKIIEADTIYIPKSVALRNDVYAIVRCCVHRLC